MKNYVDALHRFCDVKVVAPVPYFPKIKIFKRWSEFSTIEKAERHDGVDVFHPRYVVIPSVEWFSGYSYHYCLRNFLSKLRASFPFDVIHAHSVYPDGFGAVRLGRELNVPVMVTAHGSDIATNAESPLARRMTSSALLGADKIVAVSRSIGEKVMKFGPSPEKVRIIPCAAYNSEQFYLSDSANGAAGSSRKVLYIGRLVPVKGVERLIEASSWFGRMAGDEIEVLIIGDGPEKKKLLKQCVDLNISDRVRFIGEVPQAEIPKWIHLSDVLCISSYSEGLPNVAIESMACGKPVVTSAVGGLPDLIEEGVNGLLWKDENPESLARLLCDALENSWDKSAIASTVTEYVWENIARDNFSILKSLVEKRK